MKKSQFLFDELYTGIVDSKIIIIMKNIIFKVLKYIKFSIRNIILFMYFINECYSNYLQCGAYNKIYMVEGHHTPLQLFYKTYCFLRCYK